LKVTLRIAKRPCWLIWSSALWLIWGSCGPETFASRRALHLSYFIRFLLFLLNYSLQIHWAATHFGRLISRWAACHAWKAAVSSNVVQHSISVGATCTSIMALSSTRNHPPYRLLYHLAWFSQRLYLYCLGSDILGTWYLLSTYLSWSQRCTLAVFW
jgi:hypothetical protein